MKLKTVFSNFLTATLRHLPLSLLINKTSRDSARDGRLKYKLLLNNYCDITTLFLDTRFFSLMLH